MSANYAWLCGQCVAFAQTDERHGYSSSGLCSCCGARGVRVEYRPALAEAAQARAFAKSMEFPANG